VTIEDMNGVRHTLDVTAGSLYEAVALGMAAIRTDEWVSGIAQGLNPVTVQVTDVPVKTKSIAILFFPNKFYLGCEPRTAFARNRSCGMRVARTTLKRRYNNWRPLWLW